MTRCCLEFLKELGRALWGGLRYLFLPCVRRDVRERCGSFACVGGVRLHTVEGNDSDFRPGTLAAPHL